MDYRLFIARRYLASRRRISLITIITGISVVGVTLGVAALIVVLSVMNGFYDFVRELLVSLDPHVRIVAVDEREEGGRGIEGVDSLLALALAQPHVEEAAPYVQGKALLVHAGQDEANRVVIVRGVMRGAVEALGEEDADTAAVDLGREEGLPGIALGTSLAQQLGTFPAQGGMEPSSVTLLSAPAIERMLTSVFGAPQLTRFEVRSLFEMDETYDDTHVFIDLTEAQRLFRMGGRVSGVELRLDDLDRADEVKAALEKVLDPERFRVLTWYDLQRDLYDVMRLEKWGASLILFLIVVVAAFNIVGSLTMIVIEKRRDIGVLRAMGVSRSDVRRIFLLEGLLIGSVGTALGLAIGLGLALLQQYFELVPLAGAESFMIHAYPVAIRWLDVVIIGGCSVALCVLAALYPARRASAIEPARAVQYE